MITAAYIASAAKDMLKQRDAQIAALRAENARLREALRPFVFPNLGDDGSARDDRPLFGINESLMTIGDVRRARAALSGSAAP